MNPEQALILVSQAIQNRPVSPTGRWYLTVIDRKIVAIPKIQKFHPEICIGKFDEYEANDGFTIRQWNKIRCEIAALMKEKKL